jgi:hypothetical protein
VYYFFSEVPGSYCMLYTKLFNFKFLKINPFALKTAKSSFQFTHFAVNQCIKAPPFPPLFQGHISHNAYLFLLMLLLSERVADKDCKPSQQNNAIIPATFHSNGIKCVLLFPWLSFSSSSSSDLRHFSYTELLYLTPIGLVFSLLCFNKRRTQVTFF